MLGRGKDDDEDGCDCECDEDGLPCVSAIVCGVVWCGYAVRTSVSSSSDLALLCVSVSLHADTEREKEV